MNTFQVGDRVKVIIAGNGVEEELIGEIGTVVEILDPPVSATKSLPALELDVMLDRYMGSEDFIIGFHSSEVEKVQ